MHVWLVNHDFFFFVQLKLVLWSWPLSNLFYMYIFILILIFTERFICIARYIHLFSCVIVYLYIRLVNISLYKSPFLIDSKYNTCIWLYRVILIENKGMIVMIISLYMYDVSVTLLIIYPLSTHYYHYLYEP